MSVGRLAAASVAASLFAGAAGAQTPGTLEVGGFGQYTIFDDNAGAPTRGSAAGLDNEFGYGARVGVFFTPRWSIEGEGSYTKIEYPNNNNEDIDHYSPLALRLNYNFPFATNSAFIVGGGVTRSDYGFRHQYGPSGLVGARIGLGRVLALRVDGVYNYLPDENAKLSEFYVRGGLSALIPGSSPMTSEQQAQMGGAPQPGTVELGGFGQYSILDDDLNMKNTFGAGARVGVFVTPMIQPEVDFSYSEAEQEEGNVDGLRIVPTAARLNFNFPFGARNAFILGAGASRTFYQQPGLPFYRGVDEEQPTVGGSYNWGASGLAGVRIGFGQRVALRLDGVADYLPEPEFANFGVRAGLSLMLGGARPTEAAPVVVEAPVDTAPAQPAFNADSARMADSVAAAERAMREAQDAARSALQAVIYFDFDRSNIRQDAATTLDAKIPYLQSNPQMRIRIVGNTDTRGSDEYNLALGQRRAAAARRYLTQRGIEASRIEVTSRGEENPVAQNATQESEHQQNRRDEFEIVVGGENIMVPGMAGQTPMTSPSAAPSAAPTTTDTTMMRDTTGMMRDTTATPPSTLAPATPDTLNPTTPATPDTTATPSSTPPGGMPATPDTTGTPMTPGTPPTTPGSTPTTPPDTTGTPGSTPPSTTTPGSTPPTR